MQEMLLEELEKAVGTVHELTQRLDKFLTDGLGGKRALCCL